MGDDLAGQLRRQIAHTTTEKETNKLEIEVLKRAVEGHLLRLRGLLGNSEINLGSVRAAVQALDSDLKGRLDWSPELPAEKGSAESGPTYEALRNSLNDAQRRCMDLNGDMLRVADANEDIMATLKTLKGTNKRLIEEVQKQTEELSVLTQQRLLDMENLCALEDMHKQERGAWRKDHDRNLEDEHRKHEEDFEDMRDNLTSQLDACLRQGREAATRAAALHESQIKLKAEAQSFVQAVCSTLQKTERELLDRIATCGKQLQHELSQLSDTEHGLEGKLNAEKNLRQGENDTWRDRHRSLAGELDDTVERRDQGLADLHATLHSTGNARDAQAEAISKDHGALRDGIEGLAREVAHLDAARQTARRKAVQLQSHLAQVEGQRDRLHGVAETLRQHIRESDEALGDAVRSNEALREQMEVQRLDSQGANERDLKLCREMYGKKLETTRQGQHQEEQDLARRIKMLEESIGLRAGEVQAAKKQLADKRRSRVAVQKDLHACKAQHDLVARMKDDVDHEFAHVHQDKLGSELPKKQEQHDVLASRKAELEARKHAASQEAHQARKAAQARAAADAERAREIKGLHDEASNEVSRLKASLAERESGLAGARAEAAMLMQHMNEKRDSFENDLTKHAGEFEADKRDLERRIEAERLACHSLRASIQKLRGDHERHPHGAELSGRQVQPTEEGGDFDILSLKQRSDRFRTHVEDLERELSRVRAKLEQTEQEVQDGTTHLNAAKSSHRSMRDKLQREAALKAEELQRVQRATAQKLDQLRCLRDGDDARKPALRDTGEARLGVSRHQMGGDLRTSGLRTSYSPPHEPIAAPYGAGLGTRTRHGRD